MLTALVAAACSSGGSSSNASAPGTTTAPSPPASSGVDDPVAADDGGARVGADAGRKSDAGATHAASPSCAGLAQTCGPNHDTDCCAAGAVPGGTFNRLHDPAYVASVSSFRLDTYEITVARFRQFLAAYSTSITKGAGANPHDATDKGWDPAWSTAMLPNAAAVKTALKCDPNYATWTDSPTASDDKPINCVSWLEAQAFCIWDGGRLPSDTEFLYAVSGGSEQREYPWGNTKPYVDADLAVYACYYNGTGFGSCTGVTNIAPVGSVPAGNGKWGHADLGGNVAEWVFDTSGSIQIPCSDCATHDETLRMFRGDDYSTPREQFGPSDSQADFGPPTERKPTRGARCAHAP